MRYAAYYIHGAAPPAAAAYSDPLIFGAALQWLLALAVTMIAGCNTIYVITGKDGKIEDNNSVERSVDIDKSRDKGK